MTIHDHKQYILDNIHINENGCWLWKNKLDRTGYARIKYGGNQKRILVHRLSYLLFNGNIPEDDSYHGVCVCHTCDTRHCCNPKHLFLDTHDKNMQDMCDKNRQSFIQGEKHYNSILTEQQVNDIRNKYIPRKYTQHMLAYEYNVSQSTINAVLNNVNWRHI